MYESVTLAARARSFCPSPQFFQPILDEECNWHG